MGSTDKNFQPVENNFEDLDLQVFLQRKFSLKQEDLNNIGLKLSIQDYYSYLSSFSDNREVILSMYDDGELSAFNNSGLEFPKTVMVSTFVKIPEELLFEFKKTSNGKIDPGNAPANYIDTNVFITEKLKKLFSTREFTIRDSGSGSFSYRKKEVGVTVIVYSRILENWIDISIFLSSLNIVNAHGGGNFTLSLPPVVAEYTSEGEIVIDSTAKFSNENGRTGFYSRNSTHVFKKENVSNYFNDNTLHSEGEIMEGEVRVSKSTMKFFSMVISPQDLVFIKLELTKKNIDSNVFEPLNVNQDFVFKQNWDMIGLVDKISETESASTADVSITITGRDLSKLVLIDGTYFFPGTESSGDFQSQYFANREELKKTKSFTRLFGEIQEVSLFTQKSVVEIVKFLLDKLSRTQIFPNDLFSHITDEEKPEAIGVWKLVNLVPDPSVSSRLLVDSSIATNSGSIMNFLQRVCQDPFVEFFSDTYGSEFYWFVRRPPFTKKSTLSNVRVIIDDDILSNRDLVFTDDAAYSWYRLVSLGNYFGDTQFANFYFPAIFFPEFQEIFGNKPFEVTSNYLDYGGIGSRIELGYEQAKHDLKYVIETHAHLPFTRKGTIVVETDRRIRKGMSVYLRTTGEIFHVDSVSHSVTVGESIDSATTLNVSRGMILKHIDVYFNLIDFGGEQTEKDKEERLLDWKVDKDNFEFLLKRKQFFE